MKTIRSNCFETNSSSTHALTIEFPSVFRDVEMKFIIDQEFDLQESDFTNSSYDKANFFLAYAYVTNNKNLFETVVNLIEQFCGIKVTCYINKWNSVEKTRDKVVITSESFDDLSETITSQSDEKLIEELEEEDTFCYMLGEYGHDNVLDILEIVEPITKDEDKLLKIIFSNQSIFEEHSYYDG